MKGHKIVTIGCKANQYDSELLAEAFERGGLRPSEKPDVVVLNTCAVTSKAESRSRKLLRRLRRLYPEAKIILTGCSAGRIKGEKDVIVVPQSEKREIPRLLGLDVELPDVLSRASGRSRPFVKIQDGCDAFCSYCLIPHLRGRPESKPPDAVIREVRSLLDAGYHEVVLTGIHIGAYGRDMSDSSLEELIRELLEIPGKWRMRLSSIEPGELSEGMIELARHERFCPHFHIPLQSGDDEILKRMNRPYRVRDYLDVVERLRSKLDEPAITTDIIVGFPGETDEHFENTRTLVERVGFSRLHIFPFDPRPGTPAESMQGRPSHRVIRERERTLIELGHELMERFAESFVRKEVEVLAEPSTVGQLEGYSEHYVRVRFQGGSSLAGELVVVRIVGREGRIATGELVRVADLRQLC